MLGELDAMPYDASLLRTVLDEHRVTVQHLAARSGYDDKTIYRYLIGERTLPSNVIRAAFELTGDHRLIGLVTGARPLIVFCAECAAKQDKPPPPVPPLPSALKQVLDAIERAARSGRYMHQIAADGKFTDGDLTAAEKFEADATVAQERLASALAAVRHYRQEVAR